MNDELKKELGNYRRVANQFERFVFPNRLQADNFGSDFQRLLAQFLIG